MENKAGRAEVPGNGGRTGMLAERGAGQEPGYAAKPAGSGTVEQVAERIRATAAPSFGVYDARRLRSQREIIRDVMLAASDCETWLTLGELRALTKYGEASISAQLRHLRKPDNGGYEVVKRVRDGASPERVTASARGECVWEYRISRVCCAPAAGGDEAREAAAASS